MKLNEMIDWGMIISALGGVLGGSTLTGFALRKQTKGAATADAIDKYNKTFSAILDNIIKHQETFSAQIADRDKSISDRDSIIEQNKEIMYGLRSQISELKYKVAENERKMKGMQNIIDGEFKKRSFAENNICLRENCDIRIPEKGAYKKDI